MKWFNKLLCRLFGHPDWEEFITGITTKGNLEYFVPAGKRCVRCGTEILYSDTPSVGHIYLVASGQYAGFEGQCIGYSMLKSTITLKDNQENIRTFKMNDAVKK